MIPNEIKQITPEGRTPPYVSLNQNQERDSLESLQKLLGVVSEVFSDLDTTIISTTTLLRDLTNIEQHKDVRTSEKENQSLFVDFDLILKRMIDYRFIKKGNVISDKNFLFPPKNQEKKIELKNQSEFNPETQNFLLARSLNLLESSFHSLFFLPLKDVITVLIFNLFVECIELANSPNSEQTIKLYTTLFDLEAEWAAKREIRDEMKMFLLKIIDSLKLNDEEKEGMRRRARTIHTLSNMTEHLEKEAQLFAKNNKIDINVGIHKILTIQLKLINLIKPHLNFLNNKINLFNADLQIQRHLIYDNIPKEGQKNQNDIITYAKQYLIAITTLNPKSEDIRNLTSTLSTTIDLEIFNYSSFFNLLSQFGKLDSDAKNHLDKLNDFLNVCEGIIYYEYKNGRSELSDTMLLHYEAFMQWLGCFFLENIENILQTMEIKNEKDLFNINFFNNLKNIIDHLIKETPIKKIKNKFPKYKDFIEIFNEKKKGWLHTTYEKHCIVKKDFTKEFSFLNKIPSKEFHYLSVSNSLNSKLDRLHNFFNKHITEGTLSLSREDILILISEYLLREFEIITQENSEKVFNEFQEKKGISSRLLTKEEKKYAESETKFIKQIKETINPLQKIFSLLFSSSPCLLNKLIPHLPGGKADSGDLWIEALEKEEMLSLVSKQKKTFSTAIQKIEEENEEIEELDLLDQSETDFEFQLQNKIKFAELPFLLSLSQRILPKNIGSLSNVKALMRRRGEGSTFIYEVAYHLELMNSALAALELEEEENRKHLAHLLFSTFLNSQYHALERIATLPVYQKTQQLPRQHTLLALYPLEQENEGCLGLDKMTLWFRYPYSSQDHYTTHQKSLPAGLKFILEGGNTTNSFQAFAELANSGMKPFLTRLSNHVELVKEETNEAHQAFNERVESLVGYQPTTTSTTFFEKESNGQFKEWEKKLENLSLALNKRFEGLTKEPSAHADYQDFCVHLDRFSNSLKLLANRPEQEFLHLHCQQLLMASQYIVELCYILQSAEGGASAIRTHHLQSYADKIDLERKYSKETLKFVFDYVLLHKMCDYPFLTYSNNVPNKGMDLLSNSFALARMGEGFKSQKRPFISAENVHKELNDLIEGIFKFLEETCQINRGLMQCSRIP